MKFRCVPQGQLHRLLREHRFALVSAEALEQIPSECRPLSTTTEALRDSDELLPKLIDLNELTPDSRSNLLDACIDPSDRAPLAMVLLRSDVQPSTMAAHLGRAQIAQSIGGERAWLRIHDPRVWVQLNRVLSDAQLNSLMGPSQRWTFFFDGRWFTQENTGAREIGNRFDARSWSALERIGIVNRVLARMQSEVETMDSIHCTSVTADQLAQRAIEHHHISNLDDQVEFCLLGLRVHSQFDEHPQVRKILARVADDPSAFDELLANDGIYWRNISQTLNMTGEATT